MCDNVVFHRLVERKKIVYAKIRGIAKCFLLYLRTQFVLEHLVLLHFTEKESEVRGNLIICPRSAQLKEAEDSIRAHGTLKSPCFLCH